MDIGLDFVRSQVHDTIAGNAFPVRYVCGEGHVLVVTGVGSEGGVGQLEVERVIHEHAARVHGQVVGAGNKAVHVQHTV